MKTLSVLLLIMIPLCLAAETVYLTDDLGSADLGARDENILADDIHLEHAAIITNIAMPMAIAGTQDCGLWIYESLNAPPLLHWSFTNITSASRSDMKVYSFSMHLPVPKDFYIGFSAQGSGWDVNGVDAIRCGSSLLVGIASNNGTYYYGPVAGEQLTTVYSPGSPVFFTVQVKEAPLQISTMQLAGGLIELSVTNFFPETTNHLERSSGGDDWEAVTNFVAGPSGANWTDTNSSGHALYRLRRE